MTPLSEFRLALLAAMMALVLCSGCGTVGGDSANGGEIPNFNAPLGNDTSVMSGEQIVCEKVVGLGIPDDGWFTACHFLVRHAGDLGRGPLRRRDHPKVPLPRLDGDVRLDEPRPRLQGVARISSRSPPVDKARA